MSSDEFVKELQKAENFFGKELSDEQKTVWYESLKRLSLPRFKYLLSECYRRCDYMPSLAKIISLNSEIGFEANEVKLIDKSSCEICEGKGFVLYYKTIQDVTYQYGARCNCQNAKDYMNLPKLEEVGLSESQLLEKRKYQREKAKTVNINEVKKQMLMILKEVH